MLIKNKNLNQHKKKQALLLIHMRIILSEINYLIIFCHYFSLFIKHIELSILAYI